MVVHHKIVGSKGKLAHGSFSFQEEIINNIII